jgi:hypothetical protein
MMPRTTSRLAAAVSTLAIVAGGAGAAFAGEVKGPPGTPGVFGSGSEEDTAAPRYAHSICAFSGLNDFREENGQIEVIVQSPERNTGLAILLRASRAKRAKVSTSLS